MTDDSEKFELKMDYWALVANTSKHKTGGYFMFNLDGKNIDGKHPIIFDFIYSRDYSDGYGYFKGDKEAIGYAQAVGKNQKMKFKKYGIVPKALVQMMAQYWSFQGKKNPSYRNVTYGEFLTLLINGPYKSEAAKQVGEKFYRDLLIKDMPWIKRSFAMADKLYGR